MMTKEKDNLIIFPKIKKNTPKVKISEKKQKEIKDLQCKIFVSKQIETLQDELFKHFNENSIQVDRVEFQKDFAMVMESLKALLYRDFQLPHNLHKVTDKIAKPFSVDGKLLNKQTEKLMSHVQMDYRDIIFKDKVKTTDLNPETLKKLKELLSKAKDEGDKIP